MADRDGWEKEESSWGRLMAVGRDCLKDSMAGLVGSVVPIANIVAFGALIFPGDLSAGIPTVIWAMLIGGFIGGVWVALATSLPPLATGMDSPTVAVLSLLSAVSASKVAAAGGRITLWSRRLPMGIVLSVCALLRRWRVPSCRWMAPDCRWCSDDDRPDASPQ